MSWRWLAPVFCMGLLGCPDPAPDPTPVDEPAPGEPSVPGFSEDPPTPKETPVVDPNQRPLEAILRDAESLAVQGPDFEDPLGELERLQNQPRRLLEEVTARGAPAIAELSAALAGMQSYPDQTGFRDRRAFACQALGRVAHHDPAAALATLLAVDARDQKQIAESAREAPEGADVLQGWAAACERDGHDALRAVLGELAR